jgi:hypothetical protein
VFLVIKRGLAVLLVGLLVPAALQAQQPTPEQAPAEVQQLLTELHQLQERLGPIQAQAMQDSELQAAEAELNQALRSAVIEIDPAVEQDLARAETLEADAQAAQEAGDAQRLQELMTEAQGMQQRLAAAQAQALQRPGLVAQVEQFQEQLQARMIQIDPQAGELIRRHTELQRRIMEAAGAEPGG